MAGLLLGSYNILVLDEPGNHLDVETVEALAEALLRYRGTVIFTSHDRHFMKRIATNIIEVRDGSAKNYLGDYDAYLYAMNQEIEEGNRDTSAGKSDRQKTSGKAARKEMTKEERIASQQDHKRRRKQLQALERKIARLDDQKKAINEQLLTETDPKKAVELHDEVTKLVQELSDAENQWLDLSQFE
jgi:ATP-binding cassette subfamily F protein 3